MQIAILYTSTTQSLNIQTFNGISVHAIASNFIWLTDNLASIHSLYSFNNAFQPHLAQYIWHAISLLLILLKQTEG